MRPRQMLEAERRSERGKCQKKEKKYFTSQFCLNWSWIQLIVIKEYCMCSDKNIDKEFWLIIGGGLLKLSLMLYLQKGTIHRERISKKHIINWMLMLHQNWINCMLLIAFTNHKCPWVKCMGIIYIYIFP